jgi:hypothetical protein
MKSIYSVDSKFTFFNYKFSQNKITFIRIQNQNCEVMFYEVESIHYINLE